MVPEELAVLITVRSWPGVDRRKLSLEAMRLLERPEERLVLASTDRLQALGYLARTGLCYGLTAAGDATLRFRLRTYKRLVYQAQALGL